MPTIGVAIAIPEPWGGVLERHRTDFGDPLAGEVPVHVTLVPPTVVEVGPGPVDNHLAEVAAMHPPFSLHLRGTATFRPVSPVVFVALSQGISACELLADETRSGPLAQDLLFPYHPHVTVAHDLDEATLDHAYASLRDFEAAFEVRHFHLYVHGDDGVWRPEQTYTLGVRR